MVRMRGTLRAQDCRETGVPPQLRGGGLPHQGRQPPSPGSEECWAHGASQVGFVLHDSDASNVLSVAANLCMLSRW